MTKSISFLIFTLICFYLPCLSDEPVKKDDEKAEKPLVEKKEEPKPIIKKLEKEMILENKESILQIPGSGSLISKELLEKFEYDDIHRVLFQVPGVYFREEDGYGLRPNIGIRGANSDRSGKVTLMEDDVLLGPAPYSAPAAYYFPMVTRMTNVAIIKGPAAIQYGPNTIGGAVQLNTRDIPSKGQGQLDISAGLNQFLKGHVYYGNTIKSFGFLGEIVHESTDGFKKLDSGGDTGFIKDEGMIKAGYTFDKSEDVYQQLELKLGYSTENSDETYLGLTDQDFADSPYRRYAASQLDSMEWNRSQIVGKYILGLGDSVMIKNNIYRQDLHRKWNKFNRFKGGPAIIDILENPNSGQEAVYYSILSGAQDSTNENEKLLIGLNDRKFISQGIQSDLEWEINSEKVQHRISFGLRLHYDEVERNHTETGYSMQNMNLINDNLGATKTTIDIGDSLAFASYLKYELQWKKLKIVPGVRYEKIFSEYENKLTNSRIKNDQFAFMPGIGSFYSITDSFGILAGVHKGFSPIAPGQSSEVKPEESVNYEMGFRFSNETSVLEFIGFYNDYSNLTSVGSFSSGASEAELNQQYNAGSVVILGFELSAKKEFQVSKKFKMPISLVYSFTDTEFQSNFESDDPQFGIISKGDELPYVPKNILNFSIGLECKNWGFSANFKHMSSMKEMAGTGSSLSGKETDAYFITDFSAFYNLKESHKFYFLINNLLDEEYMVSRRPYGARAGMPFHAMLGYKFSF